MKTRLNDEETKQIIQIIKTRFESNMSWHKEVVWANLEDKLLKNVSKIWSLNQMEKTGGEPDVIDYDATTKEYIFCDCSKESPVGRRSYCYDKEALDTRKEHKPKNSAMEMAKEMGIELLNETQYRKLQSIGNFDTKTSSWILTPNNIRKLGGALFADFRYNTVFVYHNGASSYYAARGFRGILRV